MFQTSASSPLLWKCLSRITAPLSAASTVILINIQRKQRRINFTTWTDCRLKKDSPPFINTALSWKYTLEPKANRWLEKSMAVAQTSWSADLLQTQGESVWTRSQFVFYQPCVCVRVFAEQNSRQACAGLQLSTSYLEGWLFSVFWFWQVRNSRCEEWGWLGCEVDVKLTFELYGWIYFSCVFGKNCSQQRQEMWIVSYHSSNFLVVETLYGQTLGLH